MATNSYFTQGTAGEQGLIQDLVDEQIKIFGKDVKYIPRTLVDRDSLFNEDAMSTFDSAHEIELMLLTLMVLLEMVISSQSLVSEFRIRQPSSFPAEDLLKQ